MSPLRRFCGGMSGYFGVALFVCAIMLPFPVEAGTVVERNPFDPERKPWKAPPPPLPELTSKDLQIEAIILFGSHKEVIAQLDGRLKGVLPANAAGKVRIRLGQSFGGGYVLDAVTPNQATILAGTVRHTVPLLRRVHRGAPPAPSRQSADASSLAPVPLPPAPTAAPGTAMPPPANPFAVATPGAVSAPASAPVPSVAPIEPGTPNPAPPQANPEPAAGNDTAAPQAQQPATLLDALRQAQEAKGRQNTVSSGVPFGAK